MSNSAQHENGCGRPHIGKCEVCKHLRNLKRCAAARARKKHLPFNLTTRYLGKIYWKTPVCPACHKEFLDGETSVTRRTVDRIVPEKGYTKGNVQILCDRCNRRKDRSHTMFVDVSKFEVEDGKE